MTLIYSKASGVNDSVFGKSQEPIKMYLEKLAESFEAMSAIDKIFYMDKTTQFGEKYSQETSLGDFMPVGENGAYPRTGMQVGFEKFIEPEEWKLQFAISQTMIEDGKLGKTIKRRGQNFTQSYYRTREKFAAELLRSGNASTMTIGDRVFDTTGADGKPLFHTEHPSATRGAKLKQSNLLGLEFSYDNLSIAENAMQKFKDDEGELLNINPDTIVIPNDPAIKRTVFEVLNATGQPGDDKNDGNFQFGRWNVLVWNYLGRPTGLGNGKDWWMLMDSNARDITEGLIWLDRIPLNVHSWIDNNNDANVFNGRARFGAGVNNWRPFLASIPS